MTVVSLTANNGRNRPREGEPSTIIAALDIGSTKICCVIAALGKPKHALHDNAAACDIRIIGVGHQASRGVRAGVIVDIDEAEKAVRLAVAAAERAAGVTIGAVHVAVSGGRPRCEAFSGEARIMARDVSAVDAQRAIACAAQKIKPARRVVLHTSPVQYHLDDAQGVKQPLGMFGETLTVDLNAITVEPGALRNLGRVIGSCHLDIHGYVIAPYAGARAVLVEDEMKLGATYVELGGGTTGIASFHDGNLVFSDVLPVGGQHITSDIAQGLSTTLAHAERLKTLYGAALPAANDEHELIAVPQLGERGVDTVQRVPRSALTAIIRPRVEEILELVRDRLDRSAFGRLAGSRVVLSGGTSQLPGITDAAAAIFNRMVRAGTPLPFHSMPEHVQSASFAVPLGLLRYALKPDQLIPVSSAVRGAAADAGYLMRVGKWIKESF